MTNPSSRVLGRDAELGEIIAFLDRLESGPCALVLEGSAGIGKTTLWSAGVQAARDRGHRVLTTRAAESEARLSYAALGDMLGSVPDAALEGMPDRLRVALDGALMRSDTPGGVPDQRAVSLATGHALRNLAVESPVVIAVDDVQWLDRPSARVLSFALRRLTDEPIGTLVSLRLAADNPGDLLELDRALPATEHLSVGPLGAEPLARILRERTGAAVPPPLVTRLHRVTAGNPLFALEMARAAVDDRGRAPRGDVWSVPENLQKLLSARLAAVPPAARVPLLAIAASSQPTWDLVVEVAGSDERAMEALDRAEEAGIVERAEGRVRFSHPLLGSTLYLNAPAAERRRLHTRLAELTADPEEQARHLALAAAGPDPAVADALESAAQHARTRGAPDAAADLAGLACELTPPADAAAVRRRRLASAEYLFDGGDAVGAQLVLRETIASSPAGPERARMQNMLASMSWMNLIDGVRRPSEAARADAGDDPALRSAVDANLSWVAFYRADLPEALARARASAEWATGDLSPAVRSNALGTLALMGYLNGETDDALWSSAVQLQDDAMATTSWTEGSVYTPPGTMVGLKLMWSFRLDEARAALEHELAVFERQAMYILREEAICYLSELEGRAGNGARAAELGAEAMSILEESGQTRTQSHVVLYNQSWGAALLGQVDDARRMATDGVRLAEANDDPFTGAQNRFVLGFLDLSLADHDGACHHLELATAFVDELGAAEPGVIPSVPDLVEAYVALGRITEAEERLDSLEASSGAAGGGWALAAAARGRSLVAAGRGDLAGAEQAAKRSIEQFEALGLVFDVARSRLVLGQTHRRAKRKRVAREQLELARDTFARLGAKLWVERASSELARIGGRPSSPFALTDTEQQIAALVAQGRTNQETADALFVSASTVRSNLKRVYQKLGVRSRTELAARIGHNPGD